MSRRIFDTEEWHLAKAWGAGLEDTDARRHIGWYVDWLTRRGLVLSAYRRPDRVVDDMIVNTEGSAFSAAYYSRYYQDLDEIGVPIYRGAPGDYTRVEALLDAQHGAWRTSVGWNHPGPCDEDGFEARLAETLGTDGKEASDLLSVLRAHIASDLERGVTSGVPGIAVLKPMDVWGASNPRTGGGLSIKVGGPSFAPAWERAAASTRPYRPVIVAPTPLREALARRNKGGERFVKGFAETLHAALVRSESVSVRDLGVFRRQVRAASIQVNWVTGATEPRPGWHMESLVLAPWLAERLDTHVIESGMKVRRR